MRVMLIMPGVGRKPGEEYVRSWTMEPLGLAMLAAVTPPDVEVRLVDDRLEAIPYDDTVDLVGINVETYTARRAYAIAGAFRARGVKVVLGGYHPTLVPEEALRYGDAIVEGAAEAVWPEVLADARHHRLRRRYRGIATVLHPPVRPRRSVFGEKRYLPITLIEAGRGCRFACDFCAVCQFHQHQAVSRDVKDILGEIEEVGRRNVFFVDDNIVADPQRAKRLFTELPATGIRWFSQGAITMAQDPELLRLMARGGCEAVLIGFESLSAATLAAMGKSWNRASQDYAEAVRKIRDHGIAIYATFVFGYDTDDADAFDRTVEFASEQKFCMAAFNHLVPFPGTPLYQRLQAAGRLRFDPWWLDARYHFGEVAFEPAAMSAEELARRCYAARTRFYRMGSIVSRGLDLRCNCRGLRAAARYLWLNLFSGGQMRKRQGLPLGEGFDDAQLPEATAVPEDTEAPAEVLP